eukprot:6358379-Pyramimonas_sp.AAC.2
MKELRNTDRYCVRGTGLLRVTELPNLPRVTSRYLARVAYGSGVRWGPPPGPPPIVSFQRQDPRKTPPERGLFYFIWETH